MTTHTTRLIFTIIFLVLAVAGISSGFWFQAIFWVAIAFAVGYPFIRGGRIDLYYDDPVRLVILPSASAPTPTPASASQRQA